MADEPQKTEIVGSVKVEAADLGASPLGAAPPKVEKHTQTTETVTTTGPPPPPPPPQIIADDFIRKLMAVGLIVQFTAYITFVTYLVMTKTGELSNTANSLIMIILTAEIGYMGQTFSYYMGSSSGSTAKSQILDKAGK
jgi:hypothetical protein